MAWLWRLASPCGYANTSIVDKEGIHSEGIGSYWPFATGEKVTHANLLLDQIVNNTITQYVIAPNQHVGIWKVKRAKNAKDNSFWHISKKEHLSCLKLY